MAAMTTALTEFADNGNSRTYTTAGHTVSKPKLVIQKRRVPAGTQVVAESVFSIIHGTEDANGDNLDQKVTFEAKVRYPLDSIAADLSAAELIFRDLVAGDEFASSIRSQNWVS